MSSKYLADLITDVLQSPMKWLNTPNRHFEGRCPIELVGTPEEHKITSLLQKVDQNLR